MRGTVSLIPLRNNIINLFSLQRSSTSNNNSTTTKELHYLLRVLAAAACRTPTVFGEVAKEMLRVDTGLWKRGEPEDDPRLLVPISMHFHFVRAGSGL
jgi:hypothetical protein